LFDWVSYPVTLLVEGLYQTEMKAIQKDSLPSPFRLELIAALERILCFCHTGSTTALATSLMNPLGLSRAAVKDGFPMLLKIFMQPNIASAMQLGFQVDVRNWPLKDGYPAVASKRTQVLTYSLNHFMVRRSTSHLFLTVHILISFYRHIKLLSELTMPSLSSP
jgi:hypothetical protein